jgi:hypothetical protein
MHFDSFSFDARNFFLKLVFFFLCECDTYIVIYRINFFIGITKKSMCSH